ncbi:hypothetical protein LX36DRAFT_657782 [Colletotrichum falcatum]|nr:hypothetical protein LX36DRAFT_657782 [Colletotrichum falcatum]
MAKTQIKKAIKTRTRKNMNKTITSTTRRLARVLMPPRAVPSQTDDRCAMTRKQVVVMAIVGLLGTWDVSESDHASRPPPSLVYRV